MSDEPAPAPIHVLMARVLADMPAIGKNQRNQQQGFNFRGIDDVLDALHPLLGRHGVFYVPDVIERVAEERPTRSGGVLYTVHLHVRFRFYGPAGDYVEASGWGEGTDSGDKATNKAMTGAQKYVLFQVFAISTNEQAQEDSDRLQAPETAPSFVSRAAAKRQLIEAVHGDKDAAAAAWPFGESRQVSTVELERVLAEVAAAPAKASVPMAEEGASLFGASAGVEGTPGPRENGPGVDLPPIGAKAAQTLHKDVSRAGVTNKFDQVRLALEASDGRTEHYSELTAPEAADLLMRAEALVNARVGEVMA